MEAQTRELSCEISTTAPAARGGAACRVCALMFVGGLSLAACGERYEPKPPAPVSSAARAPRPQGAPASAPPATPATAASAPGAAPSADTAARPAKGDRAASQPASPPTPAAPPPAATPGATPRTSWPVSTASDDASLARVAGLAFTKPSAWVWTQPSMQFRALQYAVPAPAGSGAGAAELVFSVFAAGDGGPIEPNVQRWINQFRAEDGTAPAFP
jgi:hypothetical protein